MTLNYARNDYDDAYNEVQNFYYNNVSSIQEPGISRRDFKEHYNFYIFDLRYQKEHISAQQLQLQFKFSAAPGAGFVARALVLTRRILSVSTDGRTMIDIIS